MTTALRLSGATPRLTAIDGTAVLTIVESSCSMKSAVATTHGRYALDRRGIEVGVAFERGGMEFVL